MGWVSHIWTNLFCFLELKCFLQPYKYKRKKRTFRRAPWWVVRSGATTPPICRSSADLSRLFQSNPKVLPRPDDGRSSKPKPFRSAPVSAHRRCTWRSQRTSGQRSCTSETGHQGKCLGEVGDCLCDAAPSHDPRPCRCS